MFKRKIFSFGFSLSVLAILPFLSSCTGIQMAISKKDLVVNTKMSDTIFLDPSDKKTVFLQVRNTTSIPEFNLSGIIIGDLMSKGYQVVSDQEKAQYLLQVNTIYAGKTQKSVSEMLLEKGYGSDVADNAVLGAGIGALASDFNPQATIAGGIIAGLAGTFVNALVKDVTITAAADVRVSERLSGLKEKVQEIRKSNLSQGSGSKIKQTFAQKTAWMRYQTRVVTEANKVNLKLETVVHRLSQELGNSIAGIF